jgi:ADP-heptose:LPS heptosyltransferase
MDSKKINKILVINLGGIGDFLLSTPALKVLSDHLGGQSFDFLVSPRVKELAEAFPYSGKIFCFDPVKPWHYFWLPCYLRFKKYDLAINMRTLVSSKSAAKMKMILEIISPKKSAGRDTEGRGDFFDIKISEPAVGSKPEGQYDLELVAELGAKEALSKSLRPELKLDISHDNDVDRLLLAKGLKSGDILVGINPSSGTFSKRWPLENFIKAVDSLSSKGDFKFVVTGSSEDRTLSLKMAEKCGLKIYDFCGQLSILETAALIRRCRLYITNDSGFMHIAAVLGVPMVAIFGPGYLKRFDPRNIFDKAVVLTDNSDCSPCDKEECDSLKCLRKITPEIVIEACLNLLKP